MLVAWGTDLIALYNDAYVEILGKKHPQAFGKPMREIWAEVWDQAKPINDAVMAGESLWFENMPFELVGRGQATRGYFSFSYTPLLDDDGSVAGLFCAATETTQAVLWHERKNQEVERQRRLFEQAPGFICTLQGPEHTFDFVNGSYRRLFSRENIVGLTVREAFPELEGQGFFELLDQVYASGERYVARAVPASVRLQPHEPEQAFVLDFIYAPILDETGRVTGIFCEGHDVTGSVEARRMLEEREEQLRLATEHAEIGLWDVDTVNDTLYWSPRVKAMFGISPGQPVSMNDFYAYLHPGDRDRVAHAFAAACDPQIRALYDVEYRTVGKEDDRIRSVAAKGRALFEADECVRVLGVAIDVTTRKAMEDAQREADRRKDEFLATLSHELRNPLAPLSNAIHVLQRRHLGEQEGSLVDMMDRQLRHLVRLVDDLLELSRISRGAIDLQMETFDLLRALDMALEAVAPAISERRHALSFVRSSEPLWIRGDAVRLAQLIGNLLSNAARYTPDGGSIRVTTGASNGQAFICIEDNGRGFTSQERDRMFDMFVRSPDSPGLGIGLALAAQLARLQEARIDATSAGPGLGAVFTVSIPLAVDAPLTRPSSEDARPAKARRRILVVDDNVDAAESLRQLLELGGHEVHVVTSGRQAIEQFARIRPQVVLLDIGMPDMNGYDVARMLRAAAPTAKDLAIIGLSGWGQQRDRELGRAAGFDEHLVKPVAVTDLERALESASCS